MDSPSKTYITSVSTPERTIDISRWGSNPQLGSLPHQVIVVPSKSSQTTEYIKPDYYAGLSYEEITRLNTRLRCNIFYYPNPCITDLVKVGNNYKRVLYSGKAEVAVIRCVYVDIDSPGLSAKQVLKSCPIKPQAIIKSGSGFHVYFGVSPVSLVSLDGFNEKERERILKTYKAIQLKLCNSLGGDYQVARQSNSRLRVPGTINYKPKKETRCYVAYGDFKSVFEDPLYTIEGISKQLSIRFESFANKMALQKKLNPPGESERPHACYKGWEETFQNTFWDIDIKLSMKKTVRKFHRYIYGYRYLDYYLESYDLNGKSASGLFGQSMRKERIRFLRLGLIERVSDSDPTNRIAARYRLTDKFLSYLPGSEKDKYQARLERKNYSLLSKIDASKIPAHALRSDLKDLYRNLRLGNFSHDEAVSFLLPQLKKRERFDLKDNMEILNYLGDSYRALSRRSLSGD